MFILKWRNAVMPSRMTFKNGWIDFIISFWWNHNFSCGIFSSDKVTVDCLFALASTSATATMTDITFEYPLFYIGSGKNFMNKMNRPVTSSESDVKEKQLNLFLLQPYALEMQNWLQNRTICDIVWLVKNVAIARNECVIKVEISRAKTQQLMKFAFFSVGRQEKCSWQFDYFKIKRTN